MKIFIPGSKQPKTGKGFFCQRLAKALSKLDAEIVSDVIPHDVALHLVKLAKTRSKVNVIRLNGIYHDTGLDYKTRNRKIKKSLHASDAVVYQSAFSKSLCDRYLGAFKGPSTIIHNGADVKSLRKVKPVDKQCEHLFFTSSRWRPHKRLKDIIKSFLLADIKNSKLYIAGNLKKAGIKSSHKLFSEKKVHYIGVLDQGQSASYMKAADAFVHLCWFDNCPNGVVEAIAAGTPVITNNVGGTHEIVSPSGGIVCNIDKPYNLKPVKLYAPPKIDRDVIATAMQCCVEEDMDISSNHVDIRNISKKYLEFFEQVR